MRLQLRERAKSSLYFLAKGVLGFDKLAPLHLEVCNFLEHPKLRKLIVLPRGHYKTTLASISYPIWLSINDPNVRVLIASSTSTNAQKIMSLVRAKWERCEMLRWLFPELVPDPQRFKWTDASACISRTKDWPESTYEAIGAGGTAVSRHYDVIIEDDLVNEDHLINKEQMDKVIDWHQYKEALFVNPAKGNNPLIGTRWAHYDLIQWAMDNELDRVRYVRSSRENGTPIFPEEYTIQELDRLLSVMGTYKFSCQYLNDPTADTGRKFEEKWLRYFENYPDGPYNYYITCDPATSVFKAGGQVARDSDYTALVGIAVSKDNHIYVDDVQVERFGMDEFIYELFRMVETYQLRTGVAPRVGIETNAFQRALLFPIREEMKRSGTYFRVEELKASRASTKQLRILALQPYFANGAISLRKAQTALLHEYRLFPLAKHDDALDALAYAVQLAKPAHERKLPQELQGDVLSLDSIRRSLPSYKRRNQRSPWTHHFRGEKHPNIQLVR
jgi:predicted phage terminase large subunit-like protein